MKKWNAFALFYSMMPFALLSVSTAVAVAKQVPELSIHTEPVPEPRFSPRVTLSADGSYLMISTRMRDQELRMWDTRTGQISKILPPPSSVPYSEVWSIVFSPDNRYVLVTGAPYFATLYDLATNREVYTIQTYTGYVYQGFDAVATAAFTPDGKKMLMHDGKFSYSCYDVETGKAEKPSVTLGGPRRITFLPNGRDILVGWSSFLNTETDEPIKVFQNVSMAISPNHHYLAMNHYETSEWELYDLATQNPIIQTKPPIVMTGQQAISNDKKLILGSYVNREDKLSFSRKIYDVQDFQKLYEYPVDLNAGTDEPTGMDEQIEFFPDGKRFFTLNGTTIHIWDISDLQSEVTDDLKY